MRKIILLMMLLFINTGIIKSQWIMQLGEWPSAVDLVKFVNNNTGYVQPSSDSAILKTTNAGLNWIRYSSPYYSCKTFIANDSIIYKITGNYQKIVKSINGGQNWQEVYVGPEQLLDLFFVNQTTGWICGKNYNSGNLRILRTTNGGLNFQEQFSLNSIFVIGGLAFTYDTTNFNYRGFAFISNGYEVFTTNSGESWSTPFSSMYAGYDSKIKFFNMNTGFLCRGYGYNDARLYKTTNGGLNWITFNLPRNLYDGDYQVTDFTVINPDSLIYCAGGKQNILGGFLWKTTNGGMDWRIQVFDTTLFVYSAWGIDFINANTGWAFLVGGKVYKTTNGGGNSFVLTDIENINNSEEDYFLSQNYPNPFNPSTKINYEVKISGFVSLKVFDLLGKEVATLVNEKQNAGSYEVDFNSKEFNLPSGIYFYTLNEGEFKETKKMVLVK